MKKIACNILITLVSLIAVLALLWFFNGSLEMYPTEEQQGKVRVVSMMIFIICLVIDGGLLFLKRKFQKQYQK